MGSDGLVGPSTIDKRRSGNGEGSVCRAISPRLSCRGFSRKGMKIYALIGPSGTGKSHRASMVAIEKNAEAIIDDGLLIADGRIVAGYSAKREATRVAAVKRAIFSDPEHAASVRQAIARLNLSSLLILGTSVNMVNHIVRALHLDPDSVMWIPIETIASPEERALAQKIRREQGKHVIPAPTMEVRKSFSGYLIDPLRFIFGARVGRCLWKNRLCVRPIQDWDDFIFLIPLLQPLSSMRHAKVLMCLTFTGWSFKVRLPE